MVDTENIGFYAVVGVALYIGYKMMAGTANAVTAPFRFGADALNGLFGAGGSLFGGVMDTAGGVGDFIGGIGDGAGEVVNETLAVPGDLITSGQNAFDTAVGGTGDVLGDIGGGIGDIGGDIGGGIGDVGGSIGDIGGDIGSGIDDAIPDVNTPW